MDLYLSWPTIDKDLASQWPTPLYIIEWRSRQSYGEIEKLQAVVDLMPAGDSNKPKRLSELAGLLMRRFDLEGMPKDLDRAIKNQQAAVDLTPASVIPDAKECFTAIMYQQVAVNLTPAGDSSELERRGVLGTLYMDRLQGCALLEDFDLAIKNQQAVVDLTPAGDSEKLKRLSELVRLLMRRFERQSMREREYQAAVMDLRRAGDSDRLYRLRTWPDNYYYFRHLEDLDKAIKNQQAVVDLTPAGDSDKPEHLIELARLLKRRHSEQDSFRWRLFNRVEDFSYLDAAIKNQQAAVELTPAGDSTKLERLDVLAGLFMSRLCDNYRCEQKLEDLDRAIKNQQAAVDLTPAGDSKKLERLDVLFKFLARRLQREAGFEDTIKDQQTAVDLTPASDPYKPERLSKLVRSLMRRFECRRMLDAAIKSQEAAVDVTSAGSDEDKRRYLLAWLLENPLRRRTGLDYLNWAIKNQQAAVELTPAGDSNKLERLDILVGLLMLRFEGEEKLGDLDRLIKNQQAVVDLMQAGDSENSKRLGELVRLLMHRFERRGTLDDLEEAIKNQQAVVVLTPADDRQTREARLRHLGSLLDHRLETVGDHNSKIGSWPRASATMPAMLGDVKGLYKIVKDTLVEDLQQLSICVKKSKHREFSATLRRMENAVLCLKLQDGDKLCQDIFKASTRLGAYCQALRNRAGDETNKEELEDLYNEFVRIEKEFSAAHDSISSKYEQLYKQWRAERRSISKFLSKVNLTKSQGDNSEIQALVEQVDAGFEKMGNALKNEANDLKNFSETLNGLSKLIHASPDPPITSNDPAQIPPQPPDPPSTHSEVSTQVDDVIATLSQVDAVVEKSRYTKARQIVSETSSKTTQKLRTLRTSSEDYDEESRTLSCLRTRRHNDHSRDIWNRQRELCNELSKLVGGMRRMLKGIEKGFSGCKASIQGLVFRPLGDLLCDLESYMPQAGLEVSSKGLHPELILYEAALQAISDSMSSQSALLEHIKGSLSVLDKLRGV